MGCALSNYFADYLLAATRTEFDLANLVIGFEMVVVFTLLATQAPITTEGRASALYTLSKYGDDALVQLEQFLPRE